MFTKEQGQKLLKLARDAISDKFMDKKTDLMEYYEFKEKQGVFVTLTLEGELRGCIGFIEPYHPLNEAVVIAAKSAAFEDQRFNPIKREDFTKIKIEVSVLEVPKLIRVRKPQDYSNEIKIGRDGLIIKAGPYSGVLLPQVPVEYRWDVETYLRHLCMKAGLSMDAWQNINYQIYRFSAQIFKEE